MARRCKRSERRLSVSEEGYRAYQAMLRDYPEMLDPEYDPFDEVCIEWEEYEPSESELFIRSLGDFMPKLAPHEPVLHKLLGKTHEK